MYFCVFFIVCFVSFSVLFVCICVLNNCHRVATQLQLNIYHIVLLYGQPSQLYTRYVTCYVQPCYAHFYSKMDNAILIRITYNDAHCSLLLLLLTANAHNERIKASNCYA
jgi:hypothetical protein